MKKFFKAKYIITALLLLPALVHLFPMLYLLSMSLKPAATIFSYPPELIADSFEWGNYRSAFEAAPLLQFLLNSFIVASFITILQIFSSIMAAYALARFEFKGKKFIFAIIIGTMMVPGDVTIIPNYLLMANLGWLDSYVALIAPFSASGFGVFILYQFFSSVPKELEEAAFIDGASHLRYLFQILVPVSMPAVVGFGVYAFVGAWNQYLWPLIVTESEVMRTAQVGLGMFRAENETSSWGIIMAATVVLVTPTIAIFMATQKQFIRGLTMSGIKG